MIYTNFINIHNSNGQVSRLGINRPWVQKVFQNGWHKLFGIPTVPNSGNYDRNYHFYNGYNNPYSLYG